MPFKKRREVHLRNERTTKEKEMQSENAGTRSLARWLKCW